MTSPVGHGRQNRSSRDDKSWLSLARSNKLTFSTVRCALALNGEYRSGTALGRTAAAKGDGASGRKPSSRCAAGLGSRSLSFSSGAGECLDVSRGGRGRGAGEPVKKLANGSMPPPPDETSSPLPRKGVLTSLTCSRIS